jgi:hypothetical protein
MQKAKVLSNLSTEDFENYVSRINASKLPTDLKSVSSESLNFISNLIIDLRSKSVSISSLKKALNITKPEDDAPTASNDNKLKDKDSEKEVVEKLKKKRTRSGGRKSFDDYPDADTEKIYHESLKKGDVCPGCDMGKLYNILDAKLLSFKGNAPIDVIRYLVECLRCNKCGNSFKAKFNKPKWQNSARTMAVLSKLNGIPFYRLSKIQDMFGCPISDSTLWTQCLAVWNEGADKIYEGLLSEAQNSPDLYYDDTGAKILECYNDKKCCHTTIICATSKNLDHNLLIYMTKQGYSGENITPLIKNNQKLMSDASAMNIPHVDNDQLKTLVKFKCLYHAKAKFDQLIESYPKECKYFLDQISSIYAIDQQAESLSAEARLNLHKQHSQKHINNIYAKIDELFDTRVIEPNNRLGQAMRYWQNHKDGLTMFLRVEGMSLDNNVSERNLKSMILQRKNSMFFSTEKSAGILSGLASIVFTCYENNINPANYLNWIQENASKIANNSADYMPWKYEEQRNNTEKILAA